MSMALAPDVAIRHARLLLVQGKAGAARTVVGEALAHHPGEAHLYQTLCTISMSEGRPDQALDALSIALTLQPTDQDSLHAFAHLVRHSNPSRLPPHVVKNVERFLELDLDPHSLREAVTAILLQTPELSELVTLARSSDTNAFLRRLSSLPNDSALCSPLLCGLLESTPIPNRDLECVLTAIRRGLLFLCRAEGGLPFRIWSRAGRLVRALVQYSFITEYAMEQSEAEEEHLRDLLQAFSGGEPGDPMYLEQLMVLLCYRPASTLPLNQAVWSELDRASGGILQPIIEQQVTDPVKEQELLKLIPQSTPIVDEVSQRVRAQYEQSPYPRWRHKILLQEISLAHALIRQVPMARALMPDWPLRPVILVAGCGTGKHPIEVARAHPECKVLGIDLSRASLAYAERMRQKLGVSNLSFSQGDILMLGGAKAQFDAIYCSGVLHHMADPRAGWRILTDLLKPGGFMYIGLYSTIARRAIVSAQTLVAEKGYQATVDDIRRCRAELMGLPSSHPAASVPNSWADFYTLSTCRDLLFHVEEHTFSLSEIGLMLRELRLTFLGFNLESMQILRVYEKLFPDDKSATDLDNWHTLEELHPSTFSNMYQFWVHKPRSG